MSQTGVTGLKTLPSPGIGFDNPTSCEERLRFGSTERCCRFATYPTYRHIPVDRTIRWQRLARLEANRCALHKRFVVSNLSIQKPLIAATPRSSYAITRAAPRLACRKAELGSEGEHCY